MSQQSTVNHKQFQHSEDHFRVLLNNATTGYILLAPSLQILTVNRLINQWTQAEFNFLLSEKEYFPSRFPDLYQQKIIAVLMAALQGRPFRYETAYLMQNKTQSWFNIDVSPATDDTGAVVGVAIAIKEVTVRKKTESEVHAIKDALEKKVKERTAELELANKELEAFTYSVSHDLMAPLRIIDGFSQVLIDDYRNKLDDDGFQTIQIIKRNATRMGELVNDLLNLTRLGKTNITKRRVDMNELVNNVIDEMRFSTNKLSAKIKLHPLPPAECDSVLIKQVWLNLLSNAIKYSKTRENPQIEIGVANVEDKPPVYYIKDNGIGFDMQFSEKLFGVFQRLHRAEEFPGSGVGLAIVHRIITRHGGTVWAHAKTNDGAVFYFTLP